MYEAVVLGLIQGIAEWLPVSSEGLIVLARIHLFGGSESLTETIHLALFLHFGTFLAALIYFHRDVGNLLRALFTGGRSSRRATVKTLRFLVVTTLISGVLGYGLKVGISGLEASLELTGSYVTFGVGVLLLVTAWLQIRIEGDGLKSPGDLTDGDGVLLGLAQALAVLPGLSRSGLTVAALLLRKYEEVQALRLSFLMSLPIVLAGNLILNWDRVFLSAEALVSLAVSFVCGLLTIHLLLKLARAIPFGYFVLVFALVTLGAAFI